MKRIKIPMLLLSLIAFPLVAYQNCGGAFVGVGMSGQDSRKSGSGTTTDNPMQVMGLGFSGFQSTAQVRICVDNIYLTSEGRRILVQSANSELSSPKPTLTLAGSPSDTLADRGPAALANRGNGRNKRSAVLNPEIAISSTGTALTEVQVPAGTYDGVILELRNRCSFMKSIIVENPQGLFGSGAPAELNFVGALLVTNQALSLKLEIGPLVDRLNQVKDQAELPAVLASFQGLVSK